MIAVLMMLIFCATAVACVFVCACSGAISKRIDNAHIRLLMEVQKLRRENERLKNKVE